MAVVAGGYTVTPAKDADGDAGIRWVYDTISQGETFCHAGLINLTSAR